MGPIVIYTLNPWVLAGEFLALLALLVGFLWVMGKGVAALVRLVGSGIR